MRHCLRRFYNATPSEWHNWCHNASSRSDKRFEMAPLDASPSCSRHDVVAVRQNFQNLVSILTEVSITAHVLVFKSQDVSEFMRKRVLANVCRAQHDIASVDMCRVGASRIYRR